MGQTDIRRTVQPGPGWFRIRIRALRVPSGVWNVASGVACACEHSEQTSSEVTGVGSDGTPAQGQRHVVASRMFIPVPSGLADSKQELHIAGVHGDVSI